MCRTCSPEHSWQRTAEWSPWSCDARTHIELRDSRAIRSSSPRAGRDALKAWRNYCWLEPFERYMPRTLRLGFCRLVALLAVAGVMLGLAGTRASAALSWRLAGRIDAGALWGVSCPSSSLCVAVNGAGEVVTTRHPAFGRSAWTSAAVDGSNHLAGVSCPSPSLCVAADWAGNVVTSTDPAGGTGAWTVAHVDGANALSGISCPSVSLCVTVDEAGNALTSSNPAGVAGAWTSEAAARRTEH